MDSFFVNGREVASTEGDKSLLQFLRDNLGLTGTKDGCSEGACGTCTVLIDGKAVKACIPKVKSLGGKRIITIEGLTEREKEVYVYAFSKTGAVQCGFCIPGMVIAAKALLAQRPDPDLKQVKNALRGNICRCTGYVKIEEAILLAARLLREGGEVPRETFSGKLGEGFFRVDAGPKTLGTGLYVDDIKVEGMVYAAALRSKYPRARVLAIDGKRALAHPDAIRIITAADIPGKNRVGHLIKDQDTLIGPGEITHYVGDAVAIALSRRQESLGEILALIDVDYQVLTPVTSPREGLGEGAPLVQPDFSKDNILRKEHLKRGDPEGALAKSAHVVTRRYSLPFTEHAFMEPECAIALPEGDGLRLYTGGQSVYDERHQVAEMLGLPEEKIRVTSALVGGGFGGKEDLSCQHHAALAAYLTGLPVKIKFSREESLIVHPKRHAMEIDMTTGCDENGKITAVKAVIVTDTGAFASLGGPVLQRACTHAGGPYNFQDIEVTGTAVYTNNPPAGAFRGFGVTQSSFAMECNLTLLAEKVGISPWEIRYRNAIRPGQVLPNGQIADPSTGLVECLLAVRESYEAKPYTGIASCFKNSGLGVGVPDIGRCLVSVEGGKVHVRSSAACIGQGMATVLTQMACQALDFPPESIHVEGPDTERTPNTGTTTASRQTLFAGEAAVLACKKLRLALEGGKTLEELEGREFYAEFSPETDPMGSEKPNPVSHVAYGYAAQVVTLDEAGRVTEVTAAYDLGRLVNPQAAESQIEGGVVMGLGYALTEDYPVEGGYPRAKYGKLGLFRAPESPPIRVTFVEGPERLEAAFGAKGVGELATIPTAPAVQGAYYKLDGRFRQKLPMEGTAYRKEKP